MVAQLSVHPRETAAWLKEHGHEVKVTRVDGDYKPEEELEKIMWADVLIWQLPGWWMGAPWTCKKYMDVVYISGFGKIYTGDGRTRSDASKKYGSGGLCQGKYVMISSTWNAPEIAFTDKDQFFGGIGIDGVWNSFIKAHEFIGMTPLPSFASCDVIKNPHIDEDTQRLKEHLAKVFA